MAGTAGVADVDGGDDNNVELYIMGGVRRQAGREVGRQVAAVTAVAAVRGWVAISYLNVSC